MKKKQKQIKIERYNPGIELGLNSLQYQERKKNKLINKSNNKSSKSYLGIFLQNTFTYFNLIWAIIIGAYIYVGSYDNLLFVVVIFLNTFIAILQEFKAKRTVEKLSLITAPKTQVVRNGQILKIMSTSLVLDDIIILDVGNQIPADSILVSGFVEVNESLLTGESDAIRKKENDELLAGSFIVSGTCYARVNKIGNNSYIQSIAKEAKKFKSPNSNLFKDLNTIIKYIGIAIIPISAVMFFNNFFVSNDFNTAIIKTCGALTGMVPAGMFLLVTIALAVGVVKLSRKQTLIQSLYSIEMLARIDMLCLDKTGTITDGTMTVTDVELLEENDDFDRLMQSYLNAHKTNNSTSQALVKYFGNGLSYSANKIINFSSSRKYSAVHFNEFGTFLLGAPEFVCKNINKKTLTKIAKFYEQGKRVLLLARTNKEIIDEDTELIRETKPYAIIAIEDHIRDDAIETINWFKENGVKIKIISGDNPTTVSSIAKRVGVEDANACVSLEGVSLTDVAKLADNFTIFGRVSPEQKHKLIKTLKNKGYVVAMTGDGVNDTLALKEADCSIAMADGSDVARNISNIVLMDSKFSSLPAVVREGRQVINNIQNSSTLFLMKTFFAFMFSLFVIALHTTYPFESVHLILIEVFVIGIPSFILALEPNNEKIKGEFIAVVLRKAIPSALLLFVNVGIIIILDKFGIISPYETTTLTVMVLTLTGLLNLIRLCFPFTLLRFFTVALSAILVFATVSIIPEFFDIYFSERVFGILGLIVLVSIPILIFFPKLENIFKKMFSHKKKI